jgi:Transcriptional regulators
MNNLSPKIKIKDIAQRAGVSPGTVDRVLHNRGNVSEKTTQKIKKILEEINYTPNVYASALASKRIITLAAVIPDTSPGDYWEMVESGLRKGAMELSDFKVNIKLYYYSQYSIESFCHVMESILEMLPDGVLLAPSLKSVTFDFTCKMEKAGIPYVFVDSHIEGTKCLAYYGQHSYQSGQLVAKLLFSQNPSVSEIAIFSFYHAGQKPANQNALRMSGFTSYISEKNENCKLYHSTLEDGEPEQNTLEMHRLFSQHPGIGGAVIFSSRSYVVAEFLEEHQMNHISLIGYDLLERNVNYLKRNTISYLIAQRPEEQAYRGIKALSDHLLFRKQINRINYVPIDILTQENIDFYLEF